MNALPRTSYGSGEHCKLIHWPMSWVKTSQIANLLSQEFEFTSPSLSLHVRFAVCLTFDPYVRAEGRNFHCVGDFIQWFHLKRPVCNTACVYHCYAELIVSSRVVAVTIASTHYAYPLRDGQTELARGDLIECRDGRPMYERTKLQRVLKSASCVVGGAKTFILW